MMGPDKENHRPDCKKWLVYVGISFMFCIFYLIWNLVCVANVREEQFCRSLRQNVHYDYQTNTRKTTREGPWRP